MKRSFAFAALPLLFALTLSGCDQLGVETPAQTLARQEAEGKAVGGACRHAGRALEDCYRSSPKISKAAIYNGWRDMDGYMRENKIEVVPTVQPAEVKPSEASKNKSSANEDDAEAEKSPEKATETPPAKSGNKSANKQS